MHTAEPVTPVRFRLPRLRAAVAAASFGAALLGLLLVVSLGAGLAWGLRRYHRRLRRSRQPAAVPRPTAEGATAYPARH